ncbi:hypothetical protein LINPERPRIM_LOCUS23356 [Linum perenne]
MLLIQ